MNKKCELKKNVNLLDYNTYRVEARCHYMACPATLKDLENLLTYVINHQIKYFVLGNGSNVILDGYFDGLVINMKNLDKVIKKSPTDIIAYSGIMLPKLVNFCVKNNMAGLEWASGIPGTLGGAIYGNAGAYNEAIYDYLEEIIVLHNGKLETLKKSKLNYGYRTSFFQGKRQYIIIAAHLKLKPGDKETSLKIMNDRLTRRLKTQPLSYPSTGSVFRNPSKDLPAGKLIEDVNLKGYKEGGATVSTKHANFIINENKATSKDIINLISHIKKIIKEKDNIDLILEQEIVKWDSYE